MVHIDREEVSQVLEDIADLLALKGENAFKVRAYKNAARAILTMDEDLSTLVREHRLTEIRAIGTSIAEKITTLVKKGDLPYYKQLKRSIPQGLLQLLQVEGLGPKKVAVLYKKLRIKSIASLKNAAQKGKIAKLRGFGKKTEQKLLKALEQQKHYQQRHLWWDAWEVASSVLSKIRKAKGVLKADVAGSLRRGLETVGDIDFVIASSSPKEFLRWFLSQPFIKKISSHGTTKAQVVLEGDIRSDLRVVSKQEYPFTLLYFTGSREHTIELRSRAQKRGWSLSEYGIDQNTKKHRTPQQSAVTPKIQKTEKDIYALFGLPFIPPELRENRGEFEEKIPPLIEEKDLRGTFHVHTTASDGRSSLKAIAEAAEKIGWEYVGISDHSKSSVQANGLSEERMEQQISEIRAFNTSKAYSVHLFSGVECDILKDGTLDYPDSLLKKLDFVIVSVHSSLHQDEKTMTKRLIRAIEHPYTKMLGHITGRILLRREPCAVNIPKVIDACIANQTIIELNAHPSRLDMDWRWWHAASKRNLLCSINPDAHSADELCFVRAGINSARKGWLQKKQVLNTLSLNEIKQFLCYRRK